MVILRLDSEHRDLVIRLQRKLRDAHFSPGDIDGDFGPAMLAAVIGFQQSEGLLPDGIVGPQTEFKLGLSDDIVINSAIPFVTKSVVSRMFPNTQADNIKQNLPFVLDSLEDKDLIDKPMVLMALALIRAETESFRPISEFRSKFNTSPAGMHLIYMITAVT
jgi:peptidoglycan L-alanyl-D-glutamate endopeptidase CwlK